VNVLVDTSVWSLAFRRKPEELNAQEKSIVAELSELIVEGRTRILGLIRQELLSGIKSAAQYEKLRLMLRAFPDEALQTPDYEAAGMASNDCRSKGVVVSVVGVLICSVAISRNWSIFSTDPEFKNYAAILPIGLHSARK
jgi:predicted nucleic acid-binding protein